MSLHISSAFDSGNIKVISTQDVSNIELAIEKDHLSDFYQWFHFKLHNTKRVEHVLHITNASGAAFVDGWQDYQAVASYDRQHWFRVPTTYDGKNLTITFTPDNNSVYFAYFCPYSLERHQDFIHSAQLDEDCRLELLGQTLDGRDLSLLKIGKNSLTSAGQPKKIIWLTARQHPGETMAAWFIEGFIERLLDIDDGVSRWLLDHCVFYIVPNMNPDGSYRGHLRTNAAGVNLNREWLAPSMENSPEVFLVREKMQCTGVDMFLDIHGDEALPYNFVSGSEGVPSYNETMQTLENRFKKLLMAITPEFQDEKGYDKDQPGQANLTLASNWCAQQFDCLSYTLEMPFKDNALLPDALVGWSANRSSLLGRDVLSVIYHLADDLR